MAQLELDGDLGSATSTAVFSQQKLEELASDEANKVYDYEYTRLDRVLSMDEVETKLKVIRGIVVAAKKEHPDWKWVDHKKHIAEKYPDLADMSRTHPKMFDVASHTRSEARDLVPLFLQIKVMRKVNEGKITEMEGRKIVSTELQKHFKLEKGKTKDDVTPWGVSERPDWIFEKWWQK